MCKFHLPVRVGPFDPFPGLVGLDVLVAMARDVQDALESIADSENTRERQTAQVLFHAKQKTQNQLKELISIWISKKPCD